MNSILPEGKSIRTKSFYGFNPEEEGYVGWTRERDREAYLAKVKTGDIIMIYGASTSKTERSLRSYVLGFLEVDATQIRDFDKASPDILAKRKGTDDEGKWTYAIPVRRAWRAEEKVLISTIAPKSYKPQAGMTLAVHGFNLDSDEIAQALKIEVKEVNVFGEEPVTDLAAEVMPFAKVFEPSRAFPGSFGERTSSYEDGETFLYLAVFKGNGHALLGKLKPIGDESVALKIGVTNELTRRCAELNAGFPPAAIGSWKVHLYSQPFPNKDSAEIVEEKFKHHPAGKLKSLGKEFFWGNLQDAEAIFYSLPGVSRFGRQIA